MRRLGPILSDPKVLLAIIVLAGLGLRLVDAGTRINTDEGYSWLVASAPSAGSFLNRLARFENTPPLFYLLLAPLPLNSEFWLRLPSIVAGTLSIPVLYVLVRPLLGLRAALLSALGLAVAPFAVSFADFSRGFMVAGLGILVALVGGAADHLGGPSPLVVVLRDRRDAGDVLRVLLGRVRGRNYRRARRARRPATAVATRRGSVRRAALRPLPALDSGAGSLTQ